MENIKGESILDNFFDEDTMSIHLKENVSITKKKGRPGKWETQKQDEEKPSRNYLSNLINDLYKEIESTKNGFIEIDKKLSKVLQIGPYRTIITMPPLSDGLEITVVKPVKKLSLEDYELQDEVKELLADRAQGILISGAPGEGKTTFAQALIEKYVDKEKIVKTLESPRDLVVPEDVTQYSFSYATHSEIKNILLLSRPDYTVYDEVRNVEDFLLFKDLRLTGIGLLGVIHATTPVDSIQRFLGTIELGIIPQVIDTVIFIKGGGLEKILTLIPTIKVPAGMESQDLARPVVQVKDFYEDTVEYEIYTYGEQTFVMPLKENEEDSSSEKQGISKYASEYLEEYIKENFGLSVLISIESEKSIKMYIAEKNKGQIIGKGGGTINELESTLGLKINIKTFNELEKINNFDISEESPKGKKKNSALMLHLPKDMANKKVYLLIGEEELHKGITDYRAQIEIKNKRTVQKIQTQGISLLKKN